MIKYLSKLPSEDARLPRRSFLGVGAALAVAAGVPATAATPQSRPIKAGFLGVAYSHFREKHRLLRGSTDFELIGLCEEDPAVRAEWQENSRWISRETLFAEAEVVFVESAVKDHARHAVAALEAGRHVHVEKPPADNWADFQRMVGLARDRQRVFQVGYMWRYNPGLKLALEAARDGYLGRVYLVRATMNTMADAAQRKQWAQFPGGAMFEQGCHLIDGVVRLLGKPSKVTSHLQHAGEFDDTLADNTVAVFEYPSALALITSAPLQPNAGPRRFFEILGTHGTARVQPLEPPDLVIDLERAAGPYRGGTQTVTLPEYKRYRDEFTALAGAIRGAHPLPVTLDQESEIQSTLLEACRRSKGVGP
ncbi:MAG: Gfo/Idh/MocA family oxidoreductase [Pedosphaera sp.]|nr:Gfo/Idh/MocA family oxidoreductase [Pedosphaera sp.]